MFNLLKMKLANFVLITFVLLLSIATPNRAITIENSEYKDIVIEIKDNVPMDKCAMILANLEVSLSSMSHFLFTALDGRAFVSNVIVMVPASWPTTCLPQNQSFVTSSGETSDITITLPHPIYSDNIWTQQSGGCGEAGDQIYASYNALHHNTSGKEFVREWAKYRYGIFDEIGYAKDPIYPMCFRTDDKVQVTGCSDSAIKSDELCSESYDVSNSTSEPEVDSTARSSIMFLGKDPNIVMFCDEGIHNRYAPTKHNQMCKRRSTLEIILKHTDFNKSNMAQIASPTTVVNTSPRFQYKKRLITRYILVVDETIDTMIRESWSFLRMAIRKWVVYDLPDNTEVGIILINDTASARVFKITSLEVQKNRDFLASFIPFSPSESQSTGCIGCAIKDAEEMLDSRTRTNGPANSVILIVAPGMDYNTDYKGLGFRMQKRNIKIATINYPGVIRRQPLDLLAAQTTGAAYTVYESKQNGEKTFLTTYFELSNVFYDIIWKYYEGNRLDLPIEIHRKKLYDVIDDSDNTIKKISRQITATFMLDDSMGMPSSFFLFTHNAEQPLIQSAKLTSPSGVSTSIRSDQRLPVKQMALSAVISETGTWTYTIDRVNGNPQPHFVQVMASAKSPWAQIILAKSWIRKNVATKSLTLFVEVKKGELPISSALVEVTVTRPDIVCNSTMRCQQTFKLLDTGSGNPDIMRGDGIYSRYFSYAATGKGAYRFDIVVSDNGNTAYSLSSHFNLIDDLNTPTYCCGSFVPTPSRKQLPSFQRFLPSTVIFVTDKEMQTPIDANAASDLGRIGDLQWEMLEEQKVRLSWSAPDLGGINVARYEVKYAHSISDIVDNFETASIPWDHDQPFAYAIGDDTSFTMNFSAEPSLIGRRIFIAIRSYSELSKDANPSAVSNYISVFVPHPKPPSTQRPATDTFLGSAFNTGNGDADDETEGVNKWKNAASDLFGWEIIVAICVGLLLVMCCLCSYCYFCLIKRRRKQKNQNMLSAINQQKSILSKDEKTNNSNYISNSPIPSPEQLLSSQQQPPAMHHMHHDQPIYQQQCDLDIPDPHIIGLPMYSSEEDIDKQRYSIAMEHEQHLIEKMNQQQFHRVFKQCGVSVISSNNNSLARNGRILSPFNSWTASQLLHEHERRHSPYDDSIINPNMSLSGDQIYRNQQANDQLVHINNHHQQQQQDHMSLIGIPPPVPPLPYNSNEYPPNTNIYGTQQPAEQPPTYISSINQRQLPPPHQQTGVPFVPSSHQGSMNSVNSSEKKKTRNVTMV